MKANRKRRSERNDRAEVGIGTMIVFIAAVIVAAIAAAVLVNTAGNLQRTAQETGGETTEEVSSNVMIRDIVGNDSTTPNDHLDSVLWYVSLAPGAERVDLNKTPLRLQFNETNTELHTDDLDDDNCANYGSLSDGYCVKNLEQPSGDANMYILSAGDLVAIEVFYDVSSNENIEPRTDVDARLLPDSGSPVDMSFTSPSSMGGDQFVSLR